VPRSKQNHDKIEQLLGQTDYSKPMELRVERELPDQPHRAEAPPRAPQPRREEKRKPSDAFELIKPRFKVNVFDLLKSKIPSDLDGQIVTQEQSGRYLVVDKYFHDIIMGKFRSIGIEPLDGKLQALYQWFYFRSYGEGYSVCAVGHTELMTCLGWTRNTIRDLLKELEEYGLIEALQGPEFRPFDNKRPQVYKVAFPRQFVEDRWKAAKEEADRKAGEEGLAQLRAILNRHPAAKEAISELDPALKTG
jgi:hypothetical protein